MHFVDDTIAALASPAGLGPRAIVRVTGPQTRAVLNAIFLPADRDRWQSRSVPQRHPGRVQLPDWRTAIDADVLLWPGRRSYTGAPAAEISVVGSPPLVEALLQALYAAGARPARPGEFTLRAFLAGQLDLLQAEAVLGVIDAEDHAQLQRALDQLAGGMSGEIARLREQLLLHLADLEAGLDFVDDDIEFVSRDTLRAQLDAAIERIDQLARQARDRLASSGRRHVVLAGLPNAGKSTLFNRLTERDAAIVSARRGTTRDVLCAGLELDGVAITLWDTAGWEAVEDTSGSAVQVTSGAAGTAAERKAGELRDDRLARADLIVWCTAADLAAADAPLDRALYASLPKHVASLRLLTRSDLATATPRTDVGGAGDDSRFAVQPVSARTGAGLANVRAAIRDRVSQVAGHHGELLGSTAARCRETLRLAAQSLTQARDVLSAGGGDELISLELRSALDALGEVCGAIYTDDVLDRIFSRFCIGK